MQKKSTLRKHLQMLQCFATAYAKMTLLGKKSLYEVHLLYKDDFGLFYKVHRYLIGNSILPDEISENAYDVFITLLTERDIDHYNKECEKYNIKADICSFR